MMEAISFQALPSRLNMLHAIQQHVYVPKPSDVYAGEGWGIEGGVLLGIFFEMLQLWAAANSLLRIFGGYIFVGYLGYFFGFIFFVYIFGFNLAQFLYSVVFIFRYLSLFGEQISKTDR